MLAYEYGAGSARLEDLPEVPISPHLYVLCDRCASSLRAPRGWILDDRRTIANAVPAADTVRAPSSSLAPVPSAEPSQPLRVEAVEIEPEAQEDELGPIEEGQRQLAFGYSA